VIPPDPGLGALSPARIRAIRQDSFGGPEALRLVEVERPEPILTEVLVRVHAAGVNPVDWKTRAGNGMLRALPMTVRPCPWPRPPRLTRSARPATPAASSSWKSRSDTEVGGVDNRTRVPRDPVMVGRPVLAEAERAFLEIAHQPLSGPAAQPTWRGAR
jgi:hypothetical protein